MYTAMTRDPEMRIRIKPKREEDCPADEVTAYSFLGADFDSSILEQQWR